METVPFKIKRQFGPDMDPYWETFELKHQPNSNVISYLMDIRKNPVNAEGIGDPSLALVKFVNPSACVIVVLPTTPDDDWKR